MTRSTTQYSDEMLNAYLDNELHSDERKNILHDLRTDKELQDRLCQLEQVRNMVSIAYHEVPDPAMPDDNTRRGLTRKTAVAAGAVFAIVGALAGWMGHSYLKQDTSLVSLANQVQVNQPSSTQAWKVLLHVTSDEPHRLETLLNETEKILSEYDNRQQKVAIQVLANGKGLNLLRSDKSKYGKRIADLQKKYDNLIFMACAKAMSRVQQKTGNSVELLPATQIAPNALGEVLDKQRQGWTYIKI